MWEPTRDFAYLRLPTSGALVDRQSSPAPYTNPRYSHSTLPQVMVICSDGYFYAYNIDLENGGECMLMKQYSIVDSDSNGAD
ncbi:hypothetical protein ID866_8328 [Astraeus odoratus]|nr:hypothetical protein ID866_8328 [Astraeus odoratus]